MLDAKISGIRASFFNADLEKRIGKGIARSLSRCGAFVRQSAKGSLRYGKKSASPGSPPIVKRSLSRTFTNRKTGVSTTRFTSPLKELIFFAFDPQRESVVVGPKEYARGPRKYKTPAILEAGGTVTGSRPGDPSRRYRGNPFMKPALDKERAKFQALFVGLLT